MTGKHVQNCSYYACTFKLSDDFFYEFWSPRLQMVYFCPYILDIYGQTDGRKLHKQNLQARQDLQFSNVAQIVR